MLAARQQVHAKKKTMKRYERNSVNTSRKLKTKIKTRYQNKGREKNKDKDLTYLNISRQQRHAKLEYKVMRKQLIFFI